MNNILLPISTKIYAKSIVYNLVPVMPMGRKTQKEIEIEKRDKKIKKILNKIRKDIN